MKHQFLIPLQDDQVLLRPLNKADYEGLYNIAADPEIWRQHNAHDRWKPEVFEVFFEEGLKNELGSYTIVDKHTGSVMGGTRYYRFSPDNDSVFIGYTFLSRSYWGSGVNGRVKKLMLDHAFEYVRTVCFDIYENNFRSQKAVEKLGATLFCVKEDKLEYRISRQEWLMSR